MIPNALPPTPNSSHRGWHEGVRWSSPAQDPTTPVPLQVPPLPITEHMGMRYAAEPPTRSAWLPALFGALAGIIAAVFGGALVAGALAIVSVMSGSPPGHIVPLVLIGAFYGLAVASLPAGALGAGLGAIISWRPLGPTLLSLIGAIGAGVCAIIVAIVALAGSADLLVTILYLSVFALVGAISALVAAGVFSALRRVITR